MPLNKNRNFRLQVLDKCLRDPVHSYTMQELLRVCNKALVRNGYPTVKLRTMQLDVKSLLQPPFNMVLDAKSWLAGCYRYADRHQKLDLLNLSNEEKCALERTVEILGPICKIRTTRNTSGCTIACVSFSRAMLSTWMRAISLSEPMRISPA